MKQSFCTYFDRNYLTRGLCLIESLAKHCNDFEIYIVCMDEYTRITLTDLNIPHVHLIPFHDVESSDPELQATRLKRKVVEYIWTSTPSIILHVLNSNPSIRNLVYVDADLYFFSDPAVIYQELGDKSVMIHEHRFPKRIEHIAAHGIFNVGLLVFKNDIPAREVLVDWRNKCVEWCHDFIEGTKFGDQGYLNDWPQRFPQVLVTKNIGLGVAPWNHEQYRYSLNSNNIPCVDGIPIVFYHYHSFKIVHPEIFVPAPDGTFIIPEQTLTKCFMPYVHAIRRAYGLVESKEGSFPYGFAGENFSISLHQVVISSKPMSLELQKIGLTHPTEDLEPDWCVFKGPQYLS